MTRKDCIFWIGSLEDLIKEFMDDNFCRRPLAVVQEYDAAGVVVQELVFYPDKPDQPWQVIDYTDDEEPVWLTNCQLDRYGYHLENVMVEFVTAYSDWVVHMHKEFHRMNDIVSKLKYEINQDGWRAKR